MFIYPENLKAKPMLWLWELRDIGIIGVGFSPLCPGFESGGRDDTARDYRPIFLPYYSGGRLQHPGLFTEGRLFPNPAAAILRMEA